MNEDDLRISWDELTRAIEAFREFIDALSTTVEEIVEVIADIFREVEEELEEELEEEEAKKIQTREFQKWKYFFVDNFPDVRFDIKKFRKGHGIRDQPNVPNVIELYIG